MRGTDGTLAREMPAHPDRVRVRAAPDHPASQPARQRPFSAQGGGGRRAEEGVEDISTSSRDAEGATLAESTDTQTAGGGGGLSSSHERRKSSHNLETSPAQPCITVNGEGGYRPSSVCADRSGFLASEIVGRYNRYRCWAWEGCWMAARLQTADWTRQDKTRQGRA